MREWRGQWASADRGALAGADAHLGLPASAHPAPYQTLQVCAQAAGNLLWGPLLERGLLARPGPPQHIPGSLHAAQRHARARLPKSRHAGEPCPARITCVYNACPAPGGMSTAQAIHGPRAAELHVRQSGHWVCLLDGHLTARSVLFESVEDHTTICDIHHMSMSLANRSQPVQQAPALAPNSRSSSGASCNPCSRARAADSARAEPAAARPGAKGGRVCKTHPGRAHAGRAWGWG